MNWGFGFHAFNLRLSLSLLLLLPRDQKGKRWLGIGEYRGWALVFSMKVSEQLGVSQWKFPLNTFINIIVHVILWADLLHKVSCSSCTQYVDVPFISMYSVTKKKSSNTWIFCLNIVTQWLRIGKTCIRQNRSSCWRGQNVFIRNDYGPSFRKYALSQKGPEIFFGQRIKFSSHHFAVGCDRCRKCTTWVMVWKFYNRWRRWG